MLLNVSMTHIQRRIYGFSVSLFGRSRSTETYFGDEELRFESRVITVRAGRCEQKFISRYFWADLRYAVYISVFCIWIKQVKRM